MADQWEYKAAFVYNDVSAKKYTIGDFSKPGLGELLTEWAGVDGWELVNVVAEIWQPTFVNQSVPTFPYGGNVVGYRAFFKRRKP